MIRSYGCGWYGQEEDWQLVTAHEEQEPRSEYRLQEMTTIEHLTELRLRLIVSILATTAGSVVGWFMIPHVLQSFTALVGPFVFVAPTEAFFSHLKIAITIGLLLASPILVTQVWLFLLPALFPAERRTIARYMPAAFLLFGGGLAFSYWTVFPIALRFFLGFGAEDLQATLAIGRFLTFFLSVTLPFGIIFQLPLVILILVQLRLVSIAFLKRNRKLLYFLAFVVGAVLTPADIASQFLMAGPTIILFEIALWIAARRERARIKQESGTDT